VLANLHHLGTFALALFTTLSLAKVAATDIVSALTLGPWAGQQKIETILFVTGLTKEPR
jgi:hypothetical protein